MLTESAGSGGAVQGGARRIDDLGAAPRVSPVCTISSSSSFGRPHMTMSAIGSSRRRCTTSPTNVRNPSSETRERATRQSPIPGEARPLPPRTGRARLLLLPLAAHDQAPASVSEREASRSGRDRGRDRDRESQNRPESAPELHPLNDRCSLEHRPNDCRRRAATASSGPSLRPCRSRLSLCSAGSRGSRGSRNRPARSQSPPSTSSSIAASAQRRVTTRRSMKPSVRARFEYAIVEASERRIGQRLDLPVLWEGVVELHPAHVAMIPLRRPWASVASPQTIEQSV